MQPITVLYNFDSTVQGWSGEGSVSVAQVTTPRRSGIGALQATKIMGVGFDSVRFNDSGGIPDNISIYGQTIGVWVLVPADAPGTNWLAHIELQDSSFAWQPGPNFPLTPGLWTYITFTPVESLLTNCRALGLQFEANDVNQSQNVYIDDVEMYTQTPASSRWGAQLLTTAAANTLLDLPPWQGQRSSTFSFEVVDGVTGEHKGWFHPLRNKAPKITHDTTRTITRSLELTFTPSDTLRFNVFSDRVLPAMNLSDGTTWPLGRYMATDRTRIPRTSGEYASVQFVDEMFIIDQKLSSAFSPGVNSRGEPSSMGVTTLIRLLLSSFNFDIDLELSPYGTISSWSLGTSRAKALKDLCTEGGYLNPWFDHNGTLRIIRSFDPGDRIPAIDFDTNNRAFRDSISYTDDLLNAANRFIVVSNSGLEDEPRVGVYDVPDSAPYSALNRGFVIPEIIDLPTETASQSAAIARTIGQQMEIYERVELETPIDPRHDSYDVVRWNGVNWLEIGWQMDLVEGGSMSHTMRRIYR